MKKFLALTLVLLLVAALFVGCSKSEESSDKNTVVGSYKLKTVNGKTTSDYVKEDILPMQNLTEEEALSNGYTLDFVWTFEVLSDGTFTTNMVRPDGATEDNSGTWKQEGNNVIMEIDGEPMTFTFANNTLTAELGGDTLVFSK